MDVESDSLSLILNMINADNMTFIWMGTMGTLLVTVFSFMYVMKSRIQNPVIDVPEVQTNRKYRFRKRDKVQFYARKVFRKGRDTANKLQRQVSMIKEGVSVPAFSRSGRRLQNRERMMILAKKMFSGKRAPSLLQKKELPSNVLEADQYDEPAPNLPEEVLYLLQSVKVFGHFEKGVFLQLCRHMETVNLDPGEHLFKIGEADNWLYVVQEGQVNLYIDEESEVKLSEVTAGESLYSLLSILDVLTGHEAPYKTVFARATKKSIVLRLPAEAFSEAFRNRKESLVQIVQVIMTRMQRVTFLALHNYLGLSQELLRPTRHDGDYRLSIRKISSSSVLGDLVEKHDLSASQLKKQLVLTDNEDILQNIKLSPDNETCSRPLPSHLSLDELESPSKETTALPRSASQPVFINKAGSHKKKTIRFNELDTVFDDNDNVFHRQSSLPPDDKRRKEFQEKIRQAQNSSIDNLATCGNELSDDEMTTTDCAPKIFELNEPEVLDLVTDDLCQVFGIDDTETLQSYTTLWKVCKGYQLIKEGDQEVSIYFVVTGNLRVSQNLPELGFDDSRDVTLFIAKPGMLTGQLAVLTGEPSFFGVTALSDSVIAKVTRKNFYNIMLLYPRTVLNTAHTVMLRVSPFVRQIDFALDWVMVDAGKPLYKQNTYSDCMYIVLHGRLRSVVSKPDGKKELVEEFGKGEIVGMNEALRGSARTSSLHAIRDTELAKIPEGLIKHIRRRHPMVVTRLISLMSDKLLGNMLSQRSTQRNKPNDVLAHKQIMGEETTLAYGDVSNHLANLSTVAILPASHDVPLDKFSMELHHSLTHICGQVLRLSSDLIKQRLGNNALDSPHEYRLSNWLAHHEDLHQMVLYQTDQTMTKWTQRCIRQADAILIVALGDAGPSVGELEAQVEGMSVRALKIMVLLHRPGIVRPTRTVDWLNMRGGLTDHTHIKGPKRLFARTRRSKMEEYWNKLSTKPVDRFTDFSRLARFLTGTSVALVLGGGGARGLSQIGIIKSLRDAGIPIDMVGGTSIGAFMGGLWCAHRDIETMREKTLVLCDDMSSVLTKVIDLTYPFTSMFSGASFNRAIYSIFKDIQIEDLWIPYFTITTDITSSEMRVHTDGWLWRYVRASMSLSGYLPPLCDPKDGHLLMDGGYINNLPGDVARSRGASKVIAVDVGSETEMDFTNYGDYLSGWWLLWKNWSGRWTGRIKVPDLNDIQSRLSYISCHYLLEKVRHSDYCYYIRPPIIKFKTLDFHKHSELFDVGYVHGHKVFTDEWAKNFWMDLLKDNGSCASSGQSSIRADISFTDLSEMFTKMDSQTELKPYTDSEYELDYDSSPEIYHRERNKLRRMRSEPYNMYQMKSLHLYDDDSPHGFYSDPSLSRDELEDELEEDSYRSMTYLRKGSLPANMGKPLYSSEEEDDDEDDAPIKMLSSSL